MQRLSTAERLSEGLLCLHGNEASIIPASCSDLTYVGKILLIVGAVFCCRKSLETKASADISALISYYSTISKSGHSTAY